MRQHEGSATAFTVLQGILYTARHTAYAELVSDDLKTACEDVLSRSREGKKRLNQLNHWWYVNLLIPLLERLLMPGLPLHYVLRKRYIEDYVLQSIQNGTTQIINLGAGFDTLAYRLHRRYQQIHFIEIDYPATSRLKIQSLNSSLLSTENLSFIALDFMNQSLQTALDNHPHFIPDRKTLFISEGVLMYLTEPRIVCLLNDLKHFPHPGSDFIFTFAAPISKGQKGYTRLFKAYLKLKGEPLLWIKDPKAMTAFLNCHGCPLKALATHETLKTNYLPRDFPGTLPAGENIAIASLSGSGMG